MRASLFAAALLLSAPMALATVPTAAVAQSAVAAAEDARLTAFLDREFDEELRLVPQRATALGLKVHNDRLNDLSEAHQLKVLEWRRESVGRLKSRFDRAKLSPDAQASYEMWVLELERAELAYRFRRYDPPLYSALGGAQSSLPNFLINSHVVDSVADMKGYNARLRAIGPALDQAVARTRAAEADGIRLPRFQRERVISDSRRVTAGQPFAAEGPDAPLWADAKAKVGRLQAAGKVSPAQAQALLDEARTALTTSVKPAYERLVAWAESGLAAAPSGRLGAMTLPGGEAWYAAALKLNTTTDLTAEQIHQIGLSEVARIGAEMDALARQAGFADRAAFFAELRRRNPPVPWTDERRAEYLKLANGLVAKTRARLGPWFGVLPAYRMEVIREPAFSEVAGGAAHAAAPSADGSRPGRVYLHMLGVTNDPTTLPSLMCHEAVPGHVMQGDIQARQKGGPRFRSLYRYTAFSEGWGLYAEAVCKEMGVYEDPAWDFMRLNAEMFRAARLVVDTGIHAKGWTEDEAVEYLRTTSPRSEDSARSEVRRYITNAGQATAYKIGMIKMVELRREAEKALGPKFDIKGFHDLIIGSGSLPLSLLERRVKDWVAARR